MLTTTWIWPLMVITMQMTGLLLLNTSVIGLTVHRLSRTLPVQFGECPTCLNPTMVLNCFYGPGSCRMRIQGPFLSWNSVWNVYWHMYFCAVTGFWEGSRLCDGQRDGRFEFSFVAEVAYEDAKSSQHPSAAMLEKISYDKSKCNVYPPSPPFPSWKPTRMGES